MCGIIGAINHKDSLKIATRGLNLLKHRGQDSTNLHNEPGLTLGHNLHAIIKKIEQPLISKDYIFGTNCEIYNWKELNKKHNLKTNNDAETLFELLKKNKIKDTLKKLDGVFSFFFYNKKHNYILLARDVYGIKPLWFSSNNNLIFASEKKAIKDYNPQELNPRKILHYDLNTKETKFYNQLFLETKPTNKNLNELLEKAITKRIPNKKLGLLFSGGLDSTIIAYILKKQNKNFTAYLTTTNLDSKQTILAKQISEELNFELKISLVTKKDLVDAIPKVTKIIESTDPVKTEVGLTMYFSLKEAKKDNCKVIFSGVGADDVFGGYKRMLMYNKLNEDTISNLRRIYERDLYRDDTLSMHHNLELRLPFLDHDLINKVLEIPNEKKQSDIPKKILREIAIELGLNQNLTKLKRNAAQYSSGINKLFSKLIKEKNLTSKSEYLRIISKEKNIKLGILCSSGKDSLYAMHIMKRLNYELGCLITLDSKNKDSYMFHTPTIYLVKQQAKQLGIPLVFQKTNGKKEEELKDLKKAIKLAKDKYNIQGIVSGAIYSNYQRTRIENITDELNLKVFAPLWHVNQEDYMKKLIDDKYEVIITKTAADGLDDSWLGRKLDKDTLKKLKEIKNKFGIEISGEGGEYESLVLNCPLFKNKIKI